MTTQVPPLVEILAEIPDPRQNSGKRYPLAAMLTLVCVATLCGYKSILAIAEWGTNYGEEYAEKLGFNEHGYPAQASWYRVLRMVDVDLFEAKLREWVERALGTKAGQLRGVSIDGKTLRVSQKMGASNSHLLSVVTHTLGVVVGQWPVEDHTNEIGMMQRLLFDLMLEGRVVTADALLTQKEIAGTIIQKGGEYVLPLKENQPDTLAALVEWFAEDPAPYEPLNMTTRQTEKGHGRLITRHLAATTALNEYLDWPGLAQAFMLRRRVVSLATGQVRETVHYGITSLSPEQASPDDLLRFIRQHWTIENQLHTRRLPVSLA